MKVRLILLSIAFLGSIYMIPSLSAQTTTTPPNTVSHLKSERGPNDICGDSCGGDCDDYECCDPETGYDCPIPPEEPPTESCLVWLQGRPVLLLDLLPTGATHTFWSWRDGPVNAVLDAGPTGTITNLGYLNSWARFGYQGALAGDNMGTAEVLGSISGEYVCTQAGDLDRFQAQWPNNYIPYQILGPNSNSFSSRGGIVADIALAPPIYVLVPGWGK
jgi:hypothetical protein